MIFMISQLVDGIPPYLKGDPWLISAMGLLILLNQFPAVDPDQDTLAGRN